MTTNNHDRLGLNEYGPIAPVVTRRLITWAVAGVSALAALAAAAASMAHEIAPDVARACTAPLDLITALAEDGQSPTAQGTTEDGRIFTVFTNPTAGSWTMIITQPDTLRF